MGMNREWKNRQGKHIEPKSQSSLESLDINNIKTEKSVEVFTLE